jgi:L-threonylcarbamoyladenylate synthase
METQILPVDAELPEPDVVARAAAILRDGGLIAFPTETVYGLGANALDAKAVARIFTAKGRPATNPLIVHVPDVEAARSLVAEWPEVAEQLARRFWPGPLTLVLPRGPGIPDAVTAGGPTVAVRVPSHPVALALLRAAGVPLAAPSANRSTELSPTRAEHVLRGLGGRIDLILDGGPTEVGLESTVLDVSRTPPRLLRPGMVTPSALEAVIGPIEQGKGAVEGPLRSPGMMPRHYAPRAVMLCVAAGRQTPVLVADLVAAGHKVGWLSQSGYVGWEPPVYYRRMSAYPAAYAAEYYGVLHELEEAGCERIVAELPPDTEEWRAIRDRLLRATV